MIHEIQFCSSFNHDSNSFIIDHVTSFVIQRFHLWLLLRMRLKKTEAFWSEAKIFKNSKLRETLLIAFAFSCIDNEWYTHLSSFLKSLSTSYLLSVVAHADCLLLKIRIIVYSVTIENVLQQRYVEWEESSWDD